MHQLPVVGRHIAQQRPVVDTYRHVWHRDIGGGLHWQSLEATAEIIAKQTEGAANKGQVSGTQIQLPQQLLLGMGQQGEDLRGVC